MRPRTSKTDALFAVLDDLSTVRVGQPTDWLTAQNRFLRFDNRRHYGGKRHTVGGKIVRHFAVRSVNDPDTRWTGAIPVRCADVRVLPDRPHHVRTARMGMGWQAFIVNERGIVSGRDLDAPGSLKNLGETAAIFVAKARARRRQII